MRSLYCQDATQFNSNTLQTAAPLVVQPTATTTTAAATAAPSKTAPKADLFSALNKGGAITSGTSITICTSPMR